jgi:hypothetical protein
MLATSTYVWHHPSGWYYPLGWQHPLAHTQAGVLIKFGGVSLIVLVTMTVGTLHRALLTHEVKVTAFLGSPAAVEALGLTFFTPVVGDVTPHCLCFTTFTHGSSSHQRESMTSCLFQISPQ